MDKFKNKLGRTNSKNYSISYGKSYFEVVISDDKFLDYLYVEPNYQRLGLGDKLVSLVEKTNMKCDCNPYSEKILIKRGWKFLSENIKEKSIERFNNKWYEFEKIEKPLIRIETQ